METKGQTLSPSGFDPEKPLTYSFFVLVKTTNLWLQLKPAERFEFINTTLRPILKLWPHVKLRYFDSEAFTGRVTDVMFWETTSLPDYQSVVERLRETLFWGTYFEIVDIFPAIENAYADFYHQPTL